MKRLAAVILVALMVALPMQAQARSLTPAEEQYVAQMIVINLVITQSAQSVVSATNDTPSNPDAAWLARLAGVWSVFEAVDATLDEIVVPPAFAVSADLYRSAVAMMADHAQECRIAIMARLASGIDACGRYLSTSASVLRLATTALENEQVVITTG